jgi:hypothetical protein
MIEMEQIQLDEIQLIDRNEIPALTFPVEDVLVDDEWKRTRSRWIHRATSLGNLEQKKVNILFRDNESEKRVFTTIWIQVGEYILLKDRVKLPVNRITRIVID